MSDHPAPDRVEIRERARLAVVSSQAEPTKFPPAVRIDSPLLGEVARDALALLTELDRVERERDKLRELVRQASLQEAGGEDMLTGPGLAALAPTERGER